MLRKRTWMLLCALMIPALLLAACQPAATATPQATPQATQPPVATKKILRLYGGTTDIPSIDPSHSVGIAEVQVVESNTIGLVRQNEVTTEIEKGMAIDQKISGDGLTYTFTIMDNVPWVKWDADKGAVVKVKDCEGKDRMVTAEDFAYGVKRVLNPSTASEYAYVLTPYLVGANDYNSSTETDPEKLATLADAVGVKVIDPKTIEFKFNAPAVYNLNLLGLWVAHAQPKWLIEGDDCTDPRGDRWTETGIYQGYGPFTLKEWFHDSHLTLVKNPFWPGTKEIPLANIDEINYRFMDEGAAFAEYEAGNLDIVNVPSGDWDRVKNDPKFKDQIQQVVTLGTEFYSLNTALAPTDDVRVRMALAMSIDKKSLIDNVVKSGIEAPFYTNPGVAGGPKPEKYPDLGLKFDAAKAKSLLDEYLKEKNTTADKLSFTLLFNTSEDNKKTAEAIQAMWKQNLGIDVKLINQERKVFYQQRPLGKENIYRSSWVQDYPDANNFLAEVFGPDTNYSNIVKWNSGDKYTQFTGLLSQAAVEKDPAKRMDLYAQAEKILLNEQSVVIPLFWYSSPVVVRPTVKDLKSITGYDHYEKWDIVTQ